MFKLRTMHSAASKFLATSISNLIALLFLVFSMHASAFDASQYQDSSANASSVSSLDSSDIGFEAQSEPEFLQVEEAFLFNNEIVPGGLKLYFDIADDYFLYLERFRFKSLGEGATLGDPIYSNTGKKKEDPYFGEVHVIHDQVEVFLPIELAGSAEAEIKVTYQGCAEAGLCYPPTHQRAYYIPASSDDATAIIAPNSNSGSNTPTAGSGKSNSFKAPSSNPNDSSMTFMGAALFALIGGLILNLMPCVFPVLSMKALSLVNMSDEDEKTARKHGLAYTLGVVLSFVAIAGSLIALKSFGMQIGWGFQLQNPLIVGALAYLLFLIGLNLSGFFDLTVSFSNMGQSLTERSGASGSFFTGVLAALVASPCVAPFMGAAIAYALTQGPSVSLSIFALLGFGLALPYLALCYIPKLRAMLPKPGPWMGTFKELLAFPMYAAAVWLVWVLSQQSGPQGVLVVLAGMIAISFGIWLRKKSSKKFRLPINLVTTSAFVLAFASLASIQAISNSDQRFNFSETYLSEQLETTDTPIFVELTAAWCITCKVNERVALNTERTKQAFEQHKVQHIIGDWTNHDAEITTYLEKFNRNGVPLYVYYGPRDLSGSRPEPVLLPQILTQDLVIEYISSSNSLAQNTR